mmetsp:Transcript_21875/g.3633  ORF Transcript_21875/g.3633 Transcript_21875/m.3633 type:complete len:84 (+) Transcript_21875:1953-2204(+)
MISDALKKSKLSLKDVFQPDEKQILYPDMFVKGLSRLGLEIEQDHILIILEALQYEEEDEFICVHFKEFSEIMSHYGVASQDN